MLLRELLALHGVSGNEGEVRSFILEQAKDLADRVEVDALGSVLAWKDAAKPNAKTVMLAAHMDEVGFIVQYVREDGLLRYLPVGGIDPAVCVSKRVLVGKDKVPGVLGSKAVHLQEPEERTHPFTHDKLFIDIGARDKKDALTKVKVGDFVSFDGPIVDFGFGLLKARALDARVGCAVLLELLQGRYDVNLCCAFTVQEEIGLNGSLVSARRVQPDIGIAFEGTTANDTAGARVHEEVCTLGKGPTISFMDRASIATPWLFAHLCKLAEDKGLSWQLKRGVAGGNDAGSMQRAGQGVATAVISVPCRYIHSPSPVCCLKDVEGALLLGRAFLESAGSL